MKGYERIETEQPSAAMEDYLEMITRMEDEGRVVRISELARMLHVKPSSASKMASNLRDAGYLDYERYGFLKLTARGKEAGRYLLYRHRVLQAFFCTLNGTADELEQVEKIEHFMDRRTVENLDRLTGRMKAVENVDENER